MSDVNQKREALTTYYRDQGWNHEKVTKMSDAQVIAIYLKFRNEGKLR